MVCPFFSLKELIMDKLTLGNLVANGNFPETIQLDRVTKAAVFIEGAIGGGSIQLKASFDGITFYNHGSPITSAGLTIIELPAGYIMAALSGATAPNINVNITR